MEPESAPSRKWDPRPILFRRYREFGDRKLRLMGAAWCELGHIEDVDERLHRLRSLIVRYPDELQLWDELRAIRSSILDYLPLEVIHEIEVDYLIALSESGPWRSLRDLMYVMMRIETHRSEPSTHGRMQDWVERIVDITFHPHPIPDMQAEWWTSEVVALAESIYAERAFDRLPILADALEDAGCDNEDILSHCRGSGPHVRGCWVVDLVLGKS